MAELINVGAIAPDFEALDQNGKIIHLSDFRGRVVVLYFYPRDNTPGCTKEACGFRDLHRDYEDKNVVVLGVSVNSVDSHRKFAEKYGLNFTLISDSSKTIARAYGAMGASSAKRVTFIIGRDGKVLRVYPKVKASEHAEEVLQDLKNLSLI